ncbi:MAG: peptidoglycan-binding protein [Halioglobus sp.]
MNIAIDMGGLTRAAIRTLHYRARGLGSLLTGIGFVLAASSVCAVTPYDPWAAQLGIDQNVSYDGTRVMEFQGGSLQMTERKAPGKMYTEINMGNMTTGVILREDLKKSYILMPSLGFYREGSLEEGKTEASNGLQFAEIEKVGKEDVNGFSSTKYKTSFEDKQGKGSGFIWVTDSGVPIKMDMVYSSQGETGHHLTMQFTELNLRDQDPGFFEVPANLKPMDMGNMANLGQMFGMGTQAPAAGSTASGTAASTGSAAGSPTDAIQSVTDSVTEGTKGLIQGMGIGGLFGMGADETAGGGATQANQASAGSGTTAVSSAELTSDNLTQTVQNHLKALGYDPGNTDGEASTQTSIAISQFQAEKGLPVTGEVTPQLVGILSAEVDKK